VSDQIVLITGTGSGLGRAIAEHLAGAGLRVFGGIRPGAESAGLRATGVTPLAIDVTDDASVQAGVAETIAEAGRIDVLINAAGMMPGGFSEAFSVAQFEAVLQINLLGPFRMMKAVLPHMRAARSGLLINVTSIGGRMATPGSGLYAASKWGLEGLAESIGYEVAKLGIDSVILEPSLYLTGLKAKGATPDDAEVLAGYTDVGDIAAKVSGRFRPMVAASGVSTDPAALAAYVAELIAMPAGARPIRTTIGFDTGTARLNDATAALQSQYLHMMGLEDMERVGGTGR
jgi:NAD(P)-dependent dehydrogenase (short-subunit alcohol dehydrogenase family)